MCQAEDCNNDTIGTSSTLSLESIISAIKSPKSSSSKKASPSSSSSSSSSKRSNKSKKNAKRKRVTFGTAEIREFQLIHDAGRGLEPYLTIDWDPVSSTTVSAKDFGRRPKGGRGAEMVVLSAFERRIKLVRSSKNFKEEAVLVGDKRSSSSSGKIKHNSNYGKMFKNAAAKMKRKLSNESAQQPMGWDDRPY